MKSDLSIIITGKSGKQYSFTFQGDKKYLPEWKADGLEIWELCNTVPVWIVDLGLCRPWIFLQDIFRFRNPFKGWEAKGGPE